MRKIKIRTDQEQITRDQIAILLRKKRMDGQVTKSDVKFIKQYFGLISVDKTIMMRR